MNQHPLQVELVGYCNLKCSYCPQPTMKRPKGFMSKDTFNKVMTLVEMAPEKHPIAFHNFGEPLMHPQIMEYLTIAKDHVPFVRMSTNAVMLTDHRIYQLKETGIDELVISLHQPVPDHIIQLAQDVLPKVTVYGRTEEENHDWGKTHDGVSYGQKCVFRDFNTYVVLWDGSINTCCIEAEKQLQLTVDDLIDGAEYEFKDIPLCKTCTVAPQTWE